MKNNTKINGLSITVNGTKTIVTIEEAKELYLKLGELFGSKTSINYPPGVRDIDKGWDEYKKEPTCIKSELLHSNADERVR